MNTYPVQIRKKGGVWQFKTEFSGWNSANYLTEGSAVTAAKMNIRDSLTPKFRISLERVTI